MIPIERFRVDFTTYILAFGIVLGNAFFPIWFFQGMEQMKYITYLNLISKITFTILVFLLVNSEKDYNIFIILNVLVAFINGILGILLIYFKYKIKIMIPTIYQ